MLWMDNLLDFDRQNCHTSFSPQNEPKNVLQCPRSLADTVEADFTFIPDGLAQAPEDIYGRSDLEDPQAKRIWELSNGAACCSYRKGIVKNNEQSLDLVPHNA